MELQQYHKTISLSPSVTGSRKCCGKLQISIYTMITLAVDIVLAISKVILVVYCNCKVIICTNEWYNFKKW